MDAQTNDQEDLSAAMCQRLEPLLKRTENDKRPVALMVCGCSGSGKSTLAKAVIRHFPTFQRVSFDGILAARHGLYGIDYQTSEHDKYADEADAEFLQTATQMLSQGNDDMVLDRAFYAKEDRDHYKQLVEGHGARWVLVYLTAPKEVLWRRIHERRSGGIHADCALDISKELLDSFYDNFEVPKGEGEVVIDTAFDV